MLFFTYVYLYLCPCITLYCFSVLPLLKFKNVLVIFVCIIRAFNVFRCIMCCAVYIVLFGFSSDL